MNLIAAPGLDTAPYTPGSEQETINPGEGLGRVAALAQHRDRITQLEQLAHRRAFIGGARVVGAGDPIAHPVADVDGAVVFVRRHHAVVHPHADYRITGYRHVVLEIHPDLVLVRAPVDLPRRSGSPRSHRELGEE